jgi:prepilin-type N-terminal cleavage/methylation domain-containing protein
MKKQQGFTLIEVIVYLALFSFIIGSFYIVLNQIILSADRSRAQVRLISEGRFVEERMRYALKGGTVDDPYAGATSTTLTINTSGFDGQIAVFNLNPEGGLTEVIGGGAEVELLGSSISVDLFECVHYGSDYPISYTHCLLTLSTRTTRGDSITYTVNMRL